MPDPNSYQALGWLIVGLAALLHMYNQVKRIFDGEKEQPAPLATYVTKLDCARNNDGIIRRVDRLEESVSEIRTEMKLDRQALMDAGDRRKNELIEAMNEAVTGVHKRVDRIMETIANFRN